MTATRAPSSEEILAKSHRENFPVASLFFPRAVRPHLVAIYGFARLADDLGDEAPGDRMAHLDWLESQVEAAFAGRASHPLLRRLTPTIRTFGLSRDPFQRLIEANRRDQAVHRYESFDALLEYCALSANPVGDLVLRVLRAWTPERARLSDATCTGLQLVEFWQDLGEDVGRGRVYVPREDLDRFGYTERDLASRVADDRFTALMRFESARTRRLLDEGRPLARTVGGRAGVALRLFTAGGLAALDDLERRGFDTLVDSAHASKPRRAWATARELVRS